MTNKLKEVINKDIKYGFLKLRQSKNGLSVITHHENEKEGYIHDTTEFIPGMTKAKYLKLAYKGKI